MKREYIETGKCIWCGRTKEERATFFKIPHILPHALGGKETCFDVCDDVILILVMTGRNMEYLKMKL